MAQNQHDTRTEANTKQTAVKYYCQLRIHVEKKKKKKKKKTEPISTKHTRKK